MSHNEGGSPVCFRYGLLERKDAIRSTKAQGKEAGDASKKRKP